MCKLFRADTITLIITLLKHNVTVLALLFLRDFEISVHISIQLLLHFHMVVYGYF